MAAEELAERNRNLQPHLGPGGALFPEGPDASYQRLREEGGGWPPRRLRLQNEIVSDMIEEARRDGVAQGRHAVVLGGLSGSGKTTMVRAHGELVVVIGPHLHIDPDDVKDRLLTKLTERGELPEVTIPDVPGLSPRERSSLLTVEAVQVADRVLRWASHAGLDVIYDRTLGNIDTARQAIQQLQERGYEVDGLYVYAPPEQAEAQAIARYAKDQERFEARREGPGGRPVSHNVYASQVDRGTGRVRNAANFSELAESGLRRATAVDNTGFLLGADGRPGEVMAMWENGLRQPVPEAGRASAERFDVSAGRSELSFQELRRRQMRERASQSTEPAQAAPETPEVDLGQSQDPELDR